MSKRVICLVLLLPGMLAFPVYAQADDEEPPQVDSTEAPYFSDLEPIEPPDPDPVSSEDPDSPDEEPCRFPPPAECGPMMGPTQPAVTWSSNENAFKFRNADGVWSIYKRCLDRTTAMDPLRRYNVGIGYIGRFIDVAGRLLVDDFRARADIDRPGYVNAVNGGLGTFGWHHARGTPGATPAGDDPTTTEIETAVDREFPGYAIEGRMCAATNSNYGIYARSWAGPVRRGPSQVNFTMDVWFRDTHGATGYGPGGNALVRVRYRYTFLTSSVRAWISVLNYPRSDAAGVPFLKEPKFTALLRGGNYKRMAIWGGDGTAYHFGAMRGRPEGTEVLPTVSSGDASRVRVRWDYGDSPGTSQADPCPSGPARCFNVVMRSYPVQPDGNILRTCDTCTPTRVPSAWENTLGLGLDGLAVASAFRAVTWPRDTRGANSVSSCGVTDAPGSEVELSQWSEQATPSMDSVRRWEHGGWKHWAPGDPDFDNQRPYSAAFTFFHGWTGGRGPGDCEPLERAFGAGQEAWGNFAIYSLGVGWERLR